MTDGYEAHVLVHQGVRVENPWPAYSQMQHEELRLAHEREMARIEAMTPGELQFEMQMHYQCKRQQQDA